MDDFAPDYDDQDEILGDINNLDDEDLDDGIQMEKAPDGGLRAWLIVLSCFGINLVVQVMASLITLGLQDSDVSKTLNITSEDAVKAVNYYNSLSDLYAPFAVLVMIKFGYKITVAVGSIIVCFSFTNMSMLGGGSESSIGGYWKFWLCGPAAIGVNFMKIGALIPVLEYFTTKRMKALVLSRLGTALGGLMIMGLMFVNGIKWRTVFRINAGLCIVTLIAGFTLRNIGIRHKGGKKEKKPKESIFKRILGIFDPPILKNRSFWIIMGIFFFFKFGITPLAITLPLVSTKISDSSGSDTTTNAFLGVAGANVGNLGGIGTAFLLKRLKFMKRFSKRSLMFVLTMVAISGPLIGVCLVPTPDSYGPYVFFNLVVMVFQVLSENMRDESIPTVFGRTNIRITESFLNMFVGVAGMVAGAIQHGVDSANSKDGWKINLKLGGSFLIIVGVVTATLIILHKLGKIKLKEKASARTDNEYTETKEEAKHENKQENKPDSDDELPKDIDDISMTVESGKLPQPAERLTGKNYEERKREQADDRSPEKSNRSSVVASDESNRMQDIYGIHSEQRHYSLGMINGNAGGQEKDRTQRVYGRPSRQKQSSGGVMNRNVQDRMHRSYSNPGFVNHPGMAPVHMYDPNTQVLYVHQVGNPIYQGQHSQPYPHGSVNVPQNISFPSYGQPPQEQRDKGKGQRKNGKEKKQKSNKSSKDKRQTFPDTDRPYRRTNSSENYVEEQITDAGTVLY